MFTFSENKIHTDYHPENWRGKKRDKVLAHRNVNIYDDPYLQTNKLQRGPEDEASSTTPASELALSVLIGVGKHSSDLKGTIAYLTSSK